MSFVRSLLPSYLVYILRSSAMSVDLRLHSGVTGSCADLFIHPFHLPPPWDPAAFIPIRDVFFLEQSPQMPCRGVFLSHVLLKLPLNFYIRCMSLGVQLQPLSPHSDPLSLTGVHGGFSSVSAVQEAQGIECDLAQDGRGVSLASAVCPPS